MSEFEIDLTPPCRLACPVDKDIPAFLRAIARGDSAEAWRIAYRDTLLPGVLGWICPRPCEDFCTLAADHQPVPVCMLKRWASEREGPIHGPAPKLGPEGPRIAVVGAGPAGLAAAHDLSVLGARVSLFDRASNPGGLMTSCIPGFRLPEVVVVEDIDRILSMGITFRPRSEIHTLEDVTALLSEGYALVILALGAGADAVPDIPGWRDSGATWTAIRFLEAFRGGQLRLPGPRAIVIGGGNSALDTARAALRAGAREIRILYRRERDAMPGTWGEVAEAEVEGISLRTQLQPVRLSWDGERLKGVVTVRTRPGSADPVDRRETLPIEGTEEFHAADVVISAVGQHHPLRDELARRGPPASRVLTCGDFAGGPSSVVQAIASGRRAAHAACRALTGLGAWAGMPGHARLREPSGPAPAPRRDSGSFPIETFNRPLIALTRRMAISAAARCLGCDQVLSLDANLCILCGQCAMKCLQDSLRWVPDAEGGDWGLDVRDTTCVRCGECVTGCPTGALSWVRWTRENRTWKEPAETAA